MSMSPSSSLSQVESLSEYDPLDLFSRERDRVQRALEALFHRPQNNLRVFRSGAEIFGGKKKRTSEVLGGNANTLHELEVGLEGFVDAPLGSRRVCLRNVLRDALSHADAMQSLLAAQKLDCYDIEGVMSIYNKHVLLNNSFRVKDGGQSFIEADAKTDTGSRLDIDNLTTAERRRALQNFLIATTAKDCGLMITFKPLEDTHLHVSSRTIVCEEASGAEFSYKVRAFSIFVLLGEGPIPFRVLACYHLGM